MEDLTWLRGELEAVADQLGIAVSYVPMPTDGGLCVVKGQRKILVSSVAPLAHQVDVLAAALRSLDTSDVYMLPKVRDAITSL